MTDNKLHYIMYTGDEVVAKADTLEELAEITGKTFKTISCIYKRRNTIRKKGKRRTFILRSDEPFAPHPTPPYSYKWLLEDWEFIGTIKEAADELGISVVTVYQWLKKDKITREKLNDVKYLKKQERPVIEEFVGSEEERKKYRDAKRKLYLERAWELGV